VSSPEAVELEEEDYRGLLALLYGIGFFILLGIGVYYRDYNLLGVILGALSTPFTLILKWYFDAKEK